MPRLPAFAALACLGLLLAACGQRQKPPQDHSGSVASVAKAPTRVPTPAPASPPAYRDDALGISIVVPPGMTLRHDFKRDYFDPDAWKLEADSESHGKPALALVLDGSNEITAAELRLGTSTDAQDLAHCLEPASNAYEDEDEPKEETVKLDGVPFRHAQAGDAGMNHYVVAETYRAVHRGRCYAIDLLVIGSSPEVYDPPRKVPFPRDVAQRRLREALAGLHFAP
ncbi:hypothetical protein [Frateuria defendens]|uniref:hypothetical protein n=1 Tax=Frateuria defendens TaxID=2219559 RepID=UPI00066FE2E3|nr:hypothetical protein [Frateuria defendens]